MKKPRKLTIKGDGKKRTPEQAVAYLRKQKGMQHLMRLLAAK